MKVFIVLHGDTEETNLRIRLGANAKLSNKGILQSEIIGEYLNNFKFDRIFSSPTIRAKRTAEIILSKLTQKRADLKIIDKNILIERKEPTKFIGTPTDEFPWEFFKKRRLNKNWRFEDGESFNDLINRVKDILDTFTLDIHPNTRTLAVTHSSIARAIFAYVILGEAITPRKYYDLVERIKIIPAGLFILEYTQEVFDSYPTWKVISWMDRSYLTNLEN